MPNTKRLKCELIEMCFDFCSDLVNDSLSCGAAEFPCFPPPALLCLFVVIWAGRWRWCGPELFTFMVIWWKRREICAEFSMAMFSLLLVWLLGHEGFQSDSFYVTWDKPLQHNPAAFGKRPWIYDGIRDQTEPQAQRERGRGHLLILSVNHHLLLLHSDVQRALIRVVCLTYVNACKPY